MDKIIIFSPKSSEEQMSEDMYKSLSGDDWHQWSLESIVIFPIPSGVKVTVVSFSETDID